ncbi:hypothetical protein CA234_03140 [Sphingomonas sp. ABOLE]|uniref:hypothetical protein n=1 Tax=Sphingomonas sp. ABOLE TaxID=1985878 RepID=UPI000F7EB89F|nr:hypothetical protein [Sphingomonas sp. ABOLE]RSV44424.1 hypothetical protein CA234_03140 [Sphingomonas sp. ABOLE]
MKNISLPILAALSLALTPSTTVVAQVRPVLVIADNRAECGIYRLALKKREENEATARRIAADMRAKGIPARVVVLQPGQLLAQAQGAPVRVVNAC